MRAGAWRTWIRRAWWTLNVPSCSARVGRAGHSRKRSNATRMAPTAASPRDSCPNIALLKSGKEGHQQTRPSVCAVPTHRAECRVACQHIYGDLL